MRNARTLTGADAAAFLREKGTRDAGNHKFTKQVFNWPYCARCGLVLLKNERTRKAARAACVIYV